MKRFSIFFLLALTFNAFATDLPTDSTVTDAHCEKAKAESQTAEPTARHPAASTTGQHANDYAVGGATR